MTTENTAANESAPAEAAATENTQEQPTESMGGNLLDSKPEKLYAGKYKSVEDLEKAYGEAQKLIGKKLHTSSGDEKQESTEQQAVDYSEVGKKFQQQLQSGNFDFDDDIKSALSQFGMTPELVKNAVQADRQSRRAQVNEKLGREVDWDSVNEWLVSNKSESEIEALNGALNAGLYGAIRDVVDEFEKANESAPAPKQGKTPNGVTGEANERTPFTSQGEISEAVKEAGKDPGKWQLIEARLKVTPDHLKAKL